MSAPVWMHSGEPGQKLTEQRPHGMTRSRPACHIAVLGKAYGTQSPKLDAAHS